MMYSDFLLWISHCCYLGCLIPQITTNHQRKCGKGVSQWMLLGYLNGYLFFLYYIFCMNLPIAYKFLVPLQAAATVTLIGQRLYFNESIRVWLLYALNTIVFVSFIPWAMKNPLGFGSICGWLALLHGAVNQLPQVFKVFQQKNVLGFSFFFVLLTGSAAVAETVGSVIGGLPLQSILNGVRGVIVCLIFCYQFSLYRE